MYEFCYVKYCACDIFKAHYNNFNLNFLKEINTKLTQNGRGRGSTKVHFDY